MSAPRLLCTIFLSNLSSCVLGFVLPLIAIAEFSASAAEVALMASLASSVPLLFGLHSGFVADRVGYAAVAKVSLLLRSVICMAVGALFVADKVGIWVCGLAWFGINAATLYYESAAWAVVPRMMRAARRIAFNARHEALLSVAALASPWLGALAIGKGHPAGIFLACAAVMSALALIAGGRVRRGHPRGDSAPAGSIVDGIRFLFRDPMQRAISWSAMTFNFFHAAFFAVFVYYAINRLGISITGLASIFFFTALGGIGGALLTPWIIRHLGAYRAAFWSMAVLFPSGMPLVAAFFMPGIAPALITVTFMAWEFAILVNVIAETTLRQERTPVAMVGSVASASRFLNWGADPLGAGLAAFLLWVVDPIVILAGAFIGMVFAFLPLHRNAGQSLSVER